jgi:hypothetical protein
MKNGWQIPLAVLVIVILFAAFNAQPMKGAADIAAWVQGVGSLLAIGAAVGIYAKQYVDKKADDEAETVAFVQAMRDEIAVIWDEYAGIRAALNGTHPDGFYSAVVPLWNDSLIVYSASPERVGKIDDPELRRLVVYTYTGLRGHLNSLRQNNVLVEEFEQSYRALPTMPPLVATPSHMQRQWQALRDFTTGLQGGSKELADLVERFLSETEAWLRRKQ